MKKLFIWKRKNGVICCAGDYKSEFSLSSHVGNEYTLGVIPPNEFTEKLLDIKRMRMYLWESAETQKQVRDLIIEYYPEWLI